MYISTAMCMSVYYANSVKKVTYVIRLISYLLNIQEVYGRKSDNFVVMTNKDWTNQVLVTAGN